jgi:hypothetical protein
MWFLGPDLIVQAGFLEVKGQWLKGKSPGNDQEMVYGLNLHGGGYLELDATLGSSFGAYLRGEYRSADVWQSNERYYRTRSWRGTLGARWVLAERAVIKAEYLRNGEYGDLPQVSNDVFTGSLVLSY